MIISMEVARLERAADDLNEAVQQLSRLDFYARRYMRGQDYEILAQVFTVLHQEILGAVSAVMGVAARMSISVQQYDLPRDTIPEAEKSVSD